MARINYYSINEPILSKNLRRFFIVPLDEAVHRTINRINKKLHRGLLPFPQNVHVEVANICNLHCVMCPIDQQTREKGFMNLETFEKIVRQCRGEFSMEKMALMGLGEPFLNPKLIAMSRYAKEQGIRHIFTSTNATIINEKMSEEIVLKSGFDLISFSFDGARKETYESIRVGASFDKVLGNILNFIQIRKKYRKKRPIINMQLLVMQETQHEVKDFVRFWNEKLDSHDIIFIRDVDTFGGQVADHRLSRQLPEIERIPCIQLWRDFAISWEGLVAVCCKDVFYKLSVGNINENTIAEIWKNEKWETIRKLHNAGRWDEIHLCKNCNEWNQ